MVDTKYPPPPPPLPGLRVHYLGRLLLRLIPAKWLLIMLPSWLTGVIRPCHMMQWNGPFSCDFHILEALQTIAYHCRFLLMFPYSPAVFIAGMAYRTIYPENFELHIKFSWNLFKNQTINSWDIPKMGAKFPTCWNMHRIAWHAILMHRRAFETHHRPGHTMRWNEEFCCDFKAFRTIADHRSLSQVSAAKSQQCGQSASHAGMFSYSPAMLIAGIVFTNIKLRNLSHISHESLLNPHYNAANRM